MRSGSRLPRALLYSFQHSGEDASTYHWYDGPEYAAFWQVCCEPDVPIYIHPSLPASYYDLPTDKMYEGLGGKYLVGPRFEFATGVSLHLLRLIVSHVLDRFPDLQIIVGHLGERLPVDFWRINHGIQDVMMKHAVVQGDAVCEAEDIRCYLENNVYLTTSGDFHAPSPTFVGDEIGADRVLFSVDHPYETIP